MPRPCAVEVHVRGYKIGQKSFADATALRRGGSRSRLQNRLEELCGCHGLAPWRFTFAATKYVRRALRMPRPCAVEVHARGYKIGQKSFADATALRRGGSRSRLQNRSEELCGCHRKFCGFLSAATVKLHGARPWHLRKFCAFFL